MYTFSTASSMNYFWEKDEVIWISSFKYQLLLMILHNSWEYCNHFTKFVPFHCSKTPWWEIILSTSISIYGYKFGANCCSRRSHLHRKNKFFYKWFTIKIFPILLHCQTETIEGFWLFSLHIIPGLARGEFTLLSKKIVTF